MAVDSRDNVYLMTRQDARVIVYDRKGNFLRSWGEDVFTPRTHGIAVGPDDMVYSVDDGDHTVRKFTPEGAQVMLIGTPGKASDTGYDGKSHSSVRHGGPPFNRPTNVVVASNGEPGVATVRQRPGTVTADGTLIQFSEPGRARPVSLAARHRISPDDRVFVTDRENDRSKSSRDGRFLDMWTHVQRPTDIAFDKDGRVYVSELWWQPGQESFTNGRIKYDLPGGVRVMDLSGNVLLHWCSADREAPGNFVAPHTLCVDSHGDLYVGEVTWTLGVSRGSVREDAHTFQKFARC